MIALILLLIIVPFILSLFIKQMIRPSECDFYFFYYTLGFLVMIAEFALICYPAIFLETPFHTVCYIVCGIYLLESVSILLWLFFKKAIPRNPLFKNRIIHLLQSPAFWIMVVFCGFQIIRLLMAQPAELRDSKSYIAMVSDILQTDQLFKTQTENGFPIKSILDTPLKCSLSPWYPFLSLLSKFSGLHPLIICSTVIPPFLLVLHYFILYSLGLILFEKQEGKPYLFVFVCAFLYEITLYCHTPTMIKLIWPMWGKGVLSMTVVPAILVLYMLYSENASHCKGWRFFVMMLLLNIAGCSMSTMAALVLPMELGLLGIIRSVRNTSVRPIVYSCVSCIPAVLYIVVYYYLSHLQSLR